jgi:hypothetical protein
MKLGLIVGAILAVLLFRGFLAQYLGPAAAPEKHDSHRKGQEP